MPPLTEAAKAELRRKKERELWWKRILAYYMMEQYEEMKKIAEGNTFDYRVSMMTGFYITQTGLLAKLLFRPKDGRSAVDLLKDMEMDEEEDSPFLKLLRSIQEDPQSEEHMKDALNECITTATPKMLEDASGRQTEFHGDVPAGRG